mmetsp:Transcript_112679/g.268553  ORF Transcript_112679/g.268553 Transcript_112679/m.268553 type:complete len:310 (+) Transcript_112679:190-1119(+)
MAPRALRAFAAAPLLGRELAAQSPAGSRMSDRASGDYDILGAARRHHRGPRRAQVLHRDLHGLGGASWLHQQVLRQVVARQAQATSAEHPRVDGRGVRGVEGHQLHRSLLLLRQQGPVRPQAPQEVLIGGLPRSRLQQRQVVWLLEGRHAGADGFHLALHRLDAAGSILALSLVVQGPQDGHAHGLPAAAGGVETHGRVRGVHGIRGRGDGGHRVALLRELDATAGAEILDEAHHRHAHVLMHLVDHAGEKCEPLRSVGMPRGHGILRALHRLQLRGGQHWRLCQPQARQEAACSGHHLRLHVRRSTAH